MDSEPSSTVPEPAPPRRSLARPILYGISAAATVVSSLLLGWRFILASVLVLAVHEFGHAGATWLFTRRFPAIVLVPPMFGLTFARPMIGRPAHEILVMKMGGVWLSGVLAFLLVPFAGATDWLYTLLLYSVFLNAFNLVPIPGMDGGAITYYLVRGRGWPQRLAITLLLAGLGALLAAWLNAVFIWVFFGLNTLAMISKAFQAPEEADALPPSALLAWIGAQIVTLTVLLHLLWMLLSLGEPWTRVSRAIGI
jgi:Zn-dependent protease